MLGERPLKGLLVLQYNFRTKVDKDMVQACQIASLLALYCLPGPTSRILE